MGLPKKWVIAIFTSLLLILILLTLKIGRKSEYCELSSKRLKFVLDRIEAVRGLDLRENVEIRIVTREWIKKNWVLPYLRQNKEEIMVEELLLKALFLLPREANLSLIKESQFEAIIAAAVGDAVYVNKGLFDPYDEAKSIEVLSHEVTHIIQRHHFSLSERKTHDGRQAISAVIEGDALITAKIFVKQYLGVEVEDHLAELYSPMNEIWLFPYRHGRSFVAELYEIGGWKEVNLALKNPPNTTEQVLHPEKYFAHEGYLKLKAPEAEGGWVLKRSDRMGEHFAFAVLLTSLEANLAREASEGWNGDNLSFYTSEESFLLVWLIAWDAEEEAIEFFDAFRSLLDIKGVKISQDLWNCSAIYFKIQLMSDKTLILASNRKNAVESFNEGKIRAVRGAIRFKGLKKTTFKALGPRSRIKDHRSLGSRALPPARIM